MKKGVFLFLLLCKVTLIFSQADIHQGSDSTLFFSFEINVSDSNVFINPNIELKKSANISIFKKIWYEQEFTSPDVNCIIYLQKYMANGIVNLSIDSPLYGSDYSERERKKLNIGNNKLPVFSLNKIFPLEQGKYRLMLKLIYFNDGEEKSINSEWISFALKDHYPYRL